MCCFRNNFSASLATLSQSFSTRGTQVNAQEIVLSPEEQTELNRRVRSATISQRDGRRARVILLAAQGCSRVDIARLTGF